MRRLTILLSLLCLAVFLTTTTTFAATKRPVKKVRITKKVAVKTVKKPVVVITKTKKPTVTKKADKSSTAKKPITLTKDQKKVTTTVSKTKTAAAAPKVSLVKYDKRTVDKNRKAWKDKSKKSKYAAPTYARKQSKDRYNTYFIMYGNSYNGFAFNDPYNHHLIFTFSDDWWRHHWTFIDKEYYDDIDYPPFEELEDKMKEWRRNGTLIADRSYRDPGMTDDIMYATGYLNRYYANHRVSKERTPTTETSSLRLVFPIAILCMFVIVAFIIIRRRR